MHTYKVIPYSVWIHAVTGARASVYGASPWTRAADRPNWSIVQRGWTVQNLTTGVVGIGRLPWEDEAEAHAWVAQERARMAAVRAEHARRYPTTVNP